LTPPSSATASRVSINRRRDIVCSAAVCLLFAGTAGALGAVCKQMPKRRTVLRVNGCGRQARGDKSARDGAAAAET
jgi:hypothetical protein